MVPTLPFLVFAAAFLYFLAAHEGWLESFARRSARRAPGPDRDTAQAQAAAGAPRPRRGDRLEVFEEFLSSLARDDSEDAP